MLLDSLSPKVITLSSFHCILNYVSTSKVERMILTIITNVPLRLKECFQLELHRQIIFKNNIGLLCLIVSETLFWFLVTVTFYLV
jgi:hypothetical protein